MLFKNHHLHCQLMTDCYEFRCLVGVDQMSSTGYKIKFLIEWFAGRISKSEILPADHLIRKLILNPAKGSRSAPTRSLNSHHSVMGWQRRCRSLKELPIYSMIKNMLTRRKESDTYLATVSRHRWSRQIMMKMKRLTQSSSSADESHSAGWKLQ